MAFLEDKIDEIRDSELRRIILQEVKKLKSEKKFGLVFEEHLPELAPIYNAPIRPGDTVAQKNGALTDTYAVTGLNGYAKGLAEFATNHGLHFGRIELIRKEGDYLKRLDLNDEEYRMRVLGVSNNSHLNDIFNGL